MRGTVRTRILLSLTTKRNDGCCPLQPVVQSCNISTMDSDNLLQWEQLPGKLEAYSAGDFKAEFGALFSTNKAEIRQVVYAWCTERQIQQVRGQSNIIYIEQTSHSLYRRHYRFAEKESNGYNWPRYDYMIRTYGPIRIYFIQVDDPKTTEKELLDRYYKEHLEYPPVNRSAM